MPLSANTYLSDTISFDVTGTSKAEDDVRFSFNPSSLKNVTEIKALGVPWLSKLEEIANERNGCGGREFAIARTEFQKASMSAVLAILAITKE